MVWGDGSGVELPDGQAEDEQSKNNDRRPPLLLGVIRVETQLAALAAREELEESIGGIHSHVSHPQHQGDADQHQGEEYRNPIAHVFLVGVRGLHPVDADPQPVLKQSPIL